MCLKERFHPYPLDCAAPISGRGMSSPAPSIRGHCWASTPIPPMPITKREQWVTRLIEHSWLTGNGSLLLQWQHSNLIVAKAGDPSPGGCNSLPTPGKKQPVFRCFIQFLCCQKRHLYKGSFTESWLIAPSPPQKRQAFESGGLQKDGKGRQC